MSTEKTAIPNNWKQTNSPHYYSYNGLIVRRIELDKGMVELRARDKNHTRHSVKAEGLPEALKKMEARL